VARPSFCRRGLLCLFVQCVSALINARVGRYKTHVRQRRLQARACHGKVSKANRRVTRRARQTRISSLTLSFFMRSLTHSLTYWYFKAIMNIIAQTFSSVGRGSLHRQAGRQARQRESMEQTNIDGCWIPRLKNAWLYSLIRSRQSWKEMHFMSLLSFLLHCLPRWIVP